MLSKLERETFIEFDEASPTATVHTCSRKLRNKLDRICKENRMFAVVLQDEWSRQYQIPKRYVSIRFTPSNIVDSEATIDCREKTICTSEQNKDQETLTREIK